ncbi:MAG: addiction module antitoxin RelB [Gammaproteobacteria bacterium]|nr:MAG: addiction module antitoxin RelB [Gammaproteobacteria bacterium]
MDLKTIEREALGLPPAHRAKLAHELLESLDALSPAEIDELWLDEAERRLKDLDEGRTQLVPAEEVYRKARALLK